MERVIIYGAGKMGERVYECLKDIYKVMFFIDKDINKQKRGAKGLEVFPPCKIKEYRNIKIIIASVYYKEMLKDISAYMPNNISVWSEAEIRIPNLEIQEQLNKRTIDLNAFFMQQDSIELNALTFMPGSSSALDYALIKMIAKVFERKVYLEIGTYIGESINSVIDLCEKCYSVTVSPYSVPYGMASWCRELNLPHYSGRLIDEKRCTTYYADSKNFDFSEIGNSVDLFFIDGDHSYEGVYHDSKNIFSVMKEDAIVIWHDVRKRSLEYNGEVVCAIRDALQEKFDHVFVCNNNLCGIYLPEKYQEKFSRIELKYEEDAPLYTYDVKIEKIRIVRGMCDGRKY